MKCKYCNKKLVKGRERRTKMFCSVSCRNRYYYKFNIKGTRDRVRKCSHEYYNKHKNEEWFKKKNRDRFYKWVDENRDRFNKLMREGFHKRMQSEEFREKRRQYRRKWTGKKRFRG